VRLWVHWGTDPVAHPPGFDLEGFTAVPQLDDPGFQQRLNGEPVGDLLCLCTTLLAFLFLVCSNFEPNED
jgi:hypothetical protein